jgi:hypothetical protein
VQVVNPLALAVFGWVRRRNAALAADLERRAEAAGAIC